MKTDTEGERGRQRENQARNTSANGVAAGGGDSSRGEGVLQRGAEDIKTNYFVFEDGAALWQMHLGSFDAAKENATRLLPTLRRSRKTQ